MQYQRGFLLVVLLLLVGQTFADRLPGEMDENQVFSIGTVLDVVGQTDESSSLDWIISSNGSIPDGTITKGVVGVVQYRNTILTNGGILNENRNFDFDSQNQGKNEYNIESEKILTYSGINGTHLAGEEMTLLSIAGAASSSTSTTIRCVFGEKETSVTPAFCNIVKATGSLINVENAQVSTQNQVRIIASSKSTPAGLAYQIAVSPDSRSGSIEANGTIQTEFAGSILEGRNKAKKSSEKIASDNSWSDTTTVSGGIASLEKTFTYLSGLKL